MSALLAAIADFRREFGPLRTAAEFFTGLALLLVGYAGAVVACLL